MGFRLQRRIGGPVGINISRGGLSASIRTRIGAFNTRGFTLHTGFKGLTYRGTWFSGKIFRARSVFSLPGLINLVLMTALLTIKIAIILAVILGLIIVSLVKLIFRLVTGRKGEPEAEAEVISDQAPPPQPPKPE